MKRNEQKQNGEKHNVVGLLWPLGALVFMLLVYAPLNIYLSNANDFSFDTLDVLKFMLPLAAAAFLICALLCLLISKAGRKLSSVAELAAFTALVACFLQGNFFASWLPTLDGSVIDWSAFGPQRFVSLTLWLLPLAVSFAVLKKFGADGLARLSSLSGKILFAYLALTLSLTMISSPYLAKDKKGISITYDYALDVSDDENLIILLLDCVDVNYYEQAVKEFPEISDVFEDFTFYRNTLSAYNLTSHSVPFILSGIWNYNDQPYDQWLLQTVVESPLFSHLRKNEYRIGLYDDTVGYVTEAYDYFENVRGAEGFVSPTGFCSMLVHLVGFRYAPFDLKPFFFTTPENIYYNSLKGEDLENAYSWENAAFYEKLLSEDLPVGSEKCYRFIHLKGGHGGYDYDIDFNYHPGEISNIECIAGAVKMTGLYLEKLKKSGVYDNSVILVMADHGSNWISEANRANPILFIKGLDERHEQFTSDAPIHYEDLQPAFIKLLAGAKSGDLFPWQEGDDRIRVYLTVDDDVTLSENLQPGYASDESTFSDSGKRYILED